MRYRTCWILLFLLVTIFPLLAQQTSEGKSSSISGRSSFPAVGPFALTIRKQVEEVNLVLSITDRDTIAQVLRAETTIYSVNVVDYPFDSDAKSGVDILKKLCDATGGAYLRAGQNGDVGHAFRRIQRELRSQYAIAYKPSNLTEQLFHRLRVVAARNLRVRCRTGYYVW